MTAEQCVAFLEALRCKKVRVKDNGWVEAACPLAKWTHTKHVDQSPSFGLSIRPGDRSFFQCFTCRSGSAEELVQTMELYAQRDEILWQYDFKTAHHLLDAEQEVLPLPEFESYTPFAATVFAEWPQYWLDSFVKAIFSAPAMAYVLSRKVPVKFVEQFDLRYDTKRQMLVFPYWDVYGRLAGARGRSVVPEMEGPKKHYDYTWEGRNNARLIWYNETALNHPGPVVAVEGQFDCLRVAQVYPKVVAALTAKPSWEKMKKLAESSMVIQIPDRDATGQESVNVYAKFCAQLGVPHKVVWLDEGVKDPDNCSPEYLRDRIAELL